MDPIEIIFRTPELKAVFSKFFKENSSNNAPYHNLWHTLCMVRFCYEGAMEEGLSESDTTDLLIAALIHDFNHSQGKRDDKNNIFNAIFSGEFLFEDTDIFNGKSDFDHRIARIIRATEYPYVIPSDELDIQQEIIRDADLLQSFEKTWFTHTVVGISTETKKELKDFIPLGVDFIKNATFNTKWAKSVYEVESPKLLRRLEMLKEVLDVPVTYTKQKERDIAREKAYQEKLDALYIKYPISTFDEEIEKIEGEGFEVYASSHSAQVWRKSDGERLATDFIIDADFCDNYNDNMVEMINAFYNGG